MKPPRPAIEDAVAAAEHFINHLRDRQVRSFKGDLLGPAGEKLWSLDVTFDREPHRPRDRSPME